MRIVYLFLFVFSGILSFAQKQETTLHFEHINTRNGLSNNNTTCIYQDRDGFMWFGTEDGLNKYDGSSVKVYRHNSTDSSSIIGNTITQITTDTHNKLWVAAHCWGLSNFNPYSGICKNFTESRASGKHLVSNCDIFVMDDGKDTTWVKNQYSISLYNPIKHTFSLKYRVPEDSTVIYKASYANGTIWMYLRASIVAYDVATKKATYHSSFFDGGELIAPPDMLNVNEDYKLIQAFSHLYLFNTKKNTQTILLQDKYITDAKVVLINNKRQLWVATSDGLFTTPLSGKKLHDKSFTQYVPNAADAHAISSKDIKNVFQDNKGIIWLATSNGIEKINPSHLNFKQILLHTATIDQKYVNYEPKNIFAEKTESGNFMYWLSYWHGPGVLKVNEVFEVQKRIVFKHPNPTHQKKGKSTHASCIFRYGKDTLCLAGWDGIWLYNDRQDKMLINYKLNEKDTLQPNITKVDYALKDAKGDIWVSTYFQDLHKLNVASSKWEHYATGKAPNKTKSSRSDFLLLDSKNRLWLDDISYFSISDKKFVHLKYDGRANHILEDSKGNIWLATENGLARFVEKTHTFKIYTTNDGLKSNQINKLIEDNDGNIWATSVYGLVSFNAATNTIRTFTTTDGLPSDNTSVNIIKDCSGKLMYQLFADNRVDAQPYIVFDPKELLQTEREIPLHFTNFTVLNKDKKFEQSLDSIRQINIHYNENLFTVHFKALDFRNSTNIRYRYKVNENCLWVDLGGQENITFSNLRGGDYVLQVQATNNAGYWMDKTLKLRIVVSSPFWQTWLFFGIILFLIATMCLYVVRRKITSIKAKTIINEQLAALEMKALKAQMNPHFIFNSLSSIQESIVYGKIDAAEKYLGKFSKLIRMVLAHSETKTICLQDELDYLNLYLELESFRFDNFDYQINTNPTIDVIFIRIPTMLIQPYLENAIRHGLSHQEGYKTLKITFQYVEKNLLHITIEDNGIGRKQSANINASREAAHISMGMKITDERLQLLKQKNASVRIEDLVNENGQAIGTRIILQIPIDK